MEYKVLMPGAIWKDFDATADPLDAETLYTRRAPDGHVEEIWRFTAMAREDGKVRVIARVVRAGNKGENSPVVLLVGEYHRPPDPDFALSLVKAGYTLVIPDISAVSKSERTMFPPSLSYGEYAKSGEHLYRITETAKDTCQYLYSVIVKRTEVFIKRNIGEGKLILMGMGDAVEVAMQVAGSGGISDALACINGSGYKEYIKRNRYGSASEESLVMDEERMCWLTGIASVAYAKNVKIPTFIAIGSNAHNSDVDRLSNLCALLGSDSVRTVISPRAGDFMLPEAYESLILWLRSVAGSTVNELPELPELKIAVKEDGRPHLEAVCDPSSMIKRTTFYYATGSYNHEVRDWHELDGVSASYSEYIATIEDYDAEAPLFAFAEVEYENGMTLTSLVEYAELKGLNVRRSDRKKSGGIVVVYRAGDEDNGFVADYDGAVLMDKNIKTVATPKGMEGVVAECGGLRTYHFFAGENAGSDKLVQIDLYAEKDTEVKVSVIGDTDDGAKIYTANITIGNTKGYFSDTKFALSDFKDDTLRAPSDWSGIRALSIRGEGLVIGSILFI